MSFAIEIDALTKRFGKVTAVDGLSLTVPEGSLFGLIGPNGAGKTTTFGVLAGFLAPTDGTIRVRGEVMRKGTPPVGKIAVLPQDAQIPPAMAVIDALELLGVYGGLDRGTARQRAQTILGRLGLDAAIAGKRVGNLSHGQRRRVGIAQTMLGDDEIIILDEPTAGLDPRAAAELRALIAELNVERTIVLSSHNLAEVESLCDHAAIIAKGQLVASGTMAQLKRASNIVHIELGAALPAPTALIERLMAMNGVDAASATEDGKALDLTLADQAGGLTNQILAEVMDAGGLVVSLTRGKSLEQRFLEET